MTNHEGKVQLIQEISRNVLNSRTHSNLREASGSVTWRDVMSCHLILGSPVTTGYYQLLPDTAGYYRMRRSPRISGISGISSDL
eukprot:558945-Amorphochlora_amoeboformis.AAC.1